MKLNENTGLGVYMCHDGYVPVKKFLLVENGKRKYSKRSKLPVFAIFKVN